MSIHVDESIVVTIDEDEFIRPQPEYEDRLEELLTGGGIVRCRTNKGEWVNVTLDMDEQSITILN